MNKIFKFLSLSIIISILMTNHSFAEELNNQNIIGGNNRFETAVEISKNFSNSNKIILVNSNSISDILCSTSLASQKNCPILLTKSNALDKTTKEEIKRLKVDTAYIIGGINSVSNKVENELSSMNIKTNRISGKDRYETSIKIANTINESSKVEKIAIVNGEQGLANGVSIASVAENKNMPIILSKKETLGQSKIWIDDNNIKQSYIIGDENFISYNIEKSLENTKRIYGKDTCETNANILKEFYNPNKVNKIYYCKGNDEETIDAMLISPLAFRENVPIVLLGEDINKSQKDIISKFKIKETKQVGYGISENIKESLYKIIKEGNVNDNKPISPKPPTEPEEPEDEHVLPDVPTEPENPEEDTPILPDVPIEPENPGQDIPTLPDNNETPNLNQVIVTTESELNKAIKDENIKLILIRKNISLSKPSIIRRPVIIDGYNEGENYKIQIKSNNNGAIMIASDDVLVRNLDIHGKTKVINVIDAKNIELKNIKVYANSTKNPAIEINSSIVNLDNIETFSDYSGIRLNTTKFKKYSEIILNGCVENLNKDKDGNYKASILIEDINNENETKRITIGEDLHEGYIEDNYETKKIYDDGLNKEHLAYYKIV